MTHFFWFISSNSFWSIHFSKYLKFWKNMVRILDHQEQGHQALNSKCNKVNLRRYNFTSFMMIKCQWFSAVYGLTGLKLPSFAKKFHWKFSKYARIFYFSLKFSQGWCYGWSHSWAVTHGVVHRSKNQEQLYRCPGDHNCYSAACVFRHGFLFINASVQNFDSQKIQIVKCLIRVKLRSWRRKFRF